MYSLGKILILFFLRNVGENDILFYFYLANDNAQLYLNDKYLFRQYFYIDVCIKIVL